jgi:hypothetical protein
MSAMTKTISSWDDAAADAFTHLNERKRNYPKKTMLSFLDELVMKGSATQAEMVEKHGPLDLIATTLGHVTTAIHGPGAVPKVGGWYSTTLSPHTYHVDPGFVAAWKAKRRLK